MREAADRREIPLRHVAYMTDAVRIGAGRKQVFGTKFRKRDGLLVPFPIERGSDVDRRRREMGLEPLHAYAARLERTFLGRGASG
jgi:LPS sulfotransferase NodH